MAARTSQRLSTGWSGRGQVQVLQAEGLLDASSSSGPSLRFELVAADPAEVVAPGLEEGVAEVGPGRLDGGRLARAGPLVDLDQRLVLGRGELAVLLPLALEEVEVVDELLEEAGLVLLVVAEGRGAARRC